MSDEINTDRAKLELNARHHAYDPQMERAVELFYSDREAWNRLPAQLRGQTDLYEGWRASYRAAVEAGVIRDDRGPSAA